MDTTMTNTRPFRGKGISWGLFGFALSAVICLVLMLNTLDQPVAGGDREYHAEFTDIAGLAKGDAVNIAGVRVGKVTGIEVEPGPDGTSIARVDFIVDKNVPVPGEAHAAVLHGDMLGLRYLSLSADTPRTGPAPFGDDRDVVQVADQRPQGADSYMAEGSTIPLNRTVPPVDLADLFNGFKPLFEALEPSQMNQMNRTIVEAFEGRQGAIEELVRAVGDVAGPFLREEQVVTELVGNLREVAGTTKDNKEEIKRMSDALATSLGGITQRNEQLGTLLDQAGPSILSIGAMVQNNGGRIQATPGELNRIGDTYNANDEQFTQALTGGSELTLSLENMASYGGMAMLYMCNFTVSEGSVEANLFGDRYTPICRGMKQ